MDGAFCAPVGSRGAGWEVEAEGVVACEGRRNVCVAPFARRDLECCSKIPGSEQCTGIYDSTHTPWW